MRRDCLPLPGCFAVSNDKKIADNYTPAKLRQEQEGIELTRQLGEALGFSQGNGEFRKFAEQVEAISSNTDRLLTLPDRFNDAFANTGWIALGSMSAEVMEKAINIKSEGDDHGADSIIADWFDRSTIRQFGINPAKSINKADDRWHQLDEALVLYEEGRYIAAVPLILIATDGVASDALGISIYARDVDTSSFDSVVGHETGLASLLSLVCRTARRSSNDNLELPERHAILHGRRPNYGTRTVAAKAWLLFIAVVEFARDRASETARRTDAEKPEPTLEESLNSLAEARAEAARNAAFVPIEFEIDPDANEAARTPLAALLKFLGAWKSKNYRELGQFSMVDAALPPNEKARQLRSAAEFVELLDYHLVSVRQTTVARFDAQVRLSVSVMGRTGAEITLPVIGFRSSVTTGISALDEENDSWRVQHNCIVAAMTQAGVSR